MPKGDAGSDRFDIVVIGAGAAGEAAATLAGQRGARVAVVDRDLFGGACPFWACMPSKALLHAAAVHKAGGDFPWQKASGFRDWMINREETDYPDDASHVKGLEAAGATAIRGVARLDGPGSVVVRENGNTQRTLATRDVIVAVGSHSRIPPIEGLDGIEYWTNIQATGTRELPTSIVILGGGPTGVELAQVYARYGVTTVIVDSNPRLLSRDHPSNSRCVEEGLRRDGVDVRTGVRATRVVAGRNGAPHRVELSDGSTADGERILVAVGRVFPIQDLGLETIGVDAGGGRLQPDDYLRIAENVYAIGDPAGPEMHTHLSHYEGETAVRIALGEDVRPDFSAIPRATYTDPEAASVGIYLDEAQERGLDAFEETADIGSSAKGYVTQSEGHATVIVDRASGTLVGAAIAGPGASEAIHEAVLAVKLGVPLHVLADTIHAFPTTSRVLGSVFASAARALER